MRETERGSSPHPVLSPLSEGASSHLDWGEERHVEALSDGERRREREGGRSGGLQGGGVGMGVRESFLISFSPHVYISSAGSAL